jgi:hypothetical protein
MISALSLRSSPFLNRVTNRRYPSALAQDDCIPYWFGMQAGRQVSSKDADAVLCVVSAAVNSLWAVNPPALLSIVLALASCVKALSLRPRVFAPLFTALISSSDLMELHTLVILEAYFPNTTMLTAQEHNSMWHRLLANLNHGALRREHTALHLAWLRQWLSRTVIASEADAIELCAALLPRIFDDPDIMQRKIGMVYELFSRAPATHRDPGAADRDGASAHAVNDHAASSLFSADTNTIAGAGSATQQPSRKAASDVDAAAAELVRDLVMDSSPIDVPKAMMKLLLCFSDHTVLPADAVQVCAPRVSSWLCVH